MPKLWDKLVGQLESKGQPKKSKDGKNAYALATSILQKNGYMKKGTRELTKKGKAKNEKA